MSQGTLDTLWKKVKHLWTNHSEKVEKGVKWSLGTDRRRQVEEASRKIEEMLEATNII